jgi:hypothetical protein
MREDNQRERSAPRQMMMRGRGMHLTSETHAGRGCKVLAQMGEVSGEVVPVVLEVLPARACVCVLWSQVNDSVRHV